MAPRQGAGEPRGAAGASTAAGGSARGLCGLSESRAEHVAPVRKHTAGWGQSEATGLFPRVMLKRAGRAPSRAVGAYSGGAGGTCREAPISAERCAARREPRDARGLLGSSPHAPPVWGAEHSPELIHHPHQHEERVLADALLECVSKRRELLVRGGRVKESTVLRGRGAWRQWGAAVSQPPPAVPTVWARGGGSREPGHGKARDSSRGQRREAGLSPGPRLFSAATSPACRTVPTAPAGPAGVSSTQGSRRTS